MTKGVFHCLLEIPFHISLAIIMGDNKTHMVVIIISLNELGIRGTQQAVAATAPAAATHHISVCSHIYVNAMQSK